MPHYSTKSAVKAYVFKKWIFYIGWIVIRTPEKSILYYDNAKTHIVHYEYGLPYMTIGFTEKDVMRRLKRYIEQHPNLMPV